IDSAFLEGCARRTVRLSIGRGRGTARTPFAANSFRASHARGTLLQGFGVDRPGHARTGPYLVFAGEAALAGRSLRDDARLWSLGKRLLSSPPPDHRDGRRICSLHLAFPHRNRVKRL